jgi:hypothetical protein
VFTLPAEVADVAFHNKTLTYDLLFKAASETMLTIAADPKHLGARIGITAVLHTWGSAMTHHPHLHMIVPGGGISPEGKRWVSSRPAFLLPVRVLGRLFRRLLLTKLLALHEAGRLAFFGSMALAFIDAEGGASGHATSRQYRVAERRSGPSASNPPRPGGGRAIADTSRKSKSP